MQKAFCSQTESYIAFYSILPTKVENKEIRCSYSSEGLIGTHIILGWAFSEALIGIRICVQVNSLEVTQGSTDEQVGV